MVVVGALLVSLRIAVGWESPITHLLDDSKSFDSDACAACGSHDLEIRAEDAYRCFACGFEVVRVGHSRARRDLRLPSWVPSQASSTVWAGRPGNACATCAGDMPLVA